MAMRIEKTFTLNAPADAVWAFLTDPRKVASCLPGAAITEEIDPKTFAGTITIKVGPVTASYRGKMRFDRLDPDAREAEIAASGQETRGKGAADMRMTSRVIERGASQTEVEIVSEVNVVGVLAQFGRGMIQDVGDQMFDKFTAAMRKQLEPAAGGGAGGSPPDVGAGPAPALRPAGPDVGAGPAPALRPAPSPEPSDPSPTAGRAQGPPPRPETSAPPVATSPPSPSLTPATATAGAASAPIPRQTEEVLDLGAIGAAAAGRAAGRTLRNPIFWIVVAAIVVVAWLMLS